MNPAAIRRAKLALGLAVSFALVLVAAVLAHAALFGEFSDYDDEGYMLLALRAWRSGNALYDRIPTIYGPFYFQSVSSVFALLRLGLDNAGARWFALGTWIGASVLCGAWSFRVHRSFLAALLAGSLAFRTLTPLTREPLHPGEVIVLLLAVAAHVGIGLSARAPRLSTWIGLGAIAAAVGLSKTNVGAFVVLAVLGTWARFAERRTGFDVHRVAFAAVLVALPFLLVHGLARGGGSDWAWSFAFLVSASLAPFAAMLFQGPGERPWRLQSMLAFLAGGSALALVSIAVLLVEGSTIHGLWKELVFAASRFPARTWLKPELPPMSALLGALALVPVGFFLRARQREEGRAAFAVLRGVAAAYVLARCALGSVPMASLPYLWILALPERERSVRERPVFFLALLVCLQSLHAFPVAGSQVAFFAFLLPVVAIAGLASAWRDLPETWRARVPAIVRTDRAAFAAAGGVALVTAFAPGKEIVLDRFRDYREKEVDLGLPGTDSMRLPEKRATVYAWAAVNLRVRADAFLGMPGNQSLHLWSGVPPPVPFYPAAWALLLGEEEQLALLDALLTHAHPCILRTSRRLGMWRGIFSMDDRAVAVRIEERFRVAGSAFGLEILLPKEESGELVLTAKRTPAPADSGSAADSVVLRMVFPAMEGIRISRLALVEANGGRVLCDTAGEGGARMRVDGALDPSISLEEERELVAVLPAAAWIDGEDACLVRAFDSRGTVVARLPVIR